MSIIKLVSQKYNIPEHKLFFYEYDKPDPYGDFNGVKTWEQPVYEGYLLIVYKNYYGGNDYVSEKPIFNPSMIDIFYHFHNALVCEEDKHHVFLESIKLDKYNGCNALFLSSGS